MLFISILVVGCRSSRPGATHDYSFPSSLPREIIILLLKLNKANTLIINKILLRYAR
nr:MAG TPA: hypothetical protein [Caudoviricetes sp.]